MEKSVFYFLVYSCVHFKIILVDEKNHRCKLISASKISEVSGQHKSHSNRKIKQLGNFLPLYPFLPLEKKGDFTEPPILQKASLLWKP